jgi:hypothetical protein
MLSAQGDSRSPKENRSSAQGERRFSWRIILVGIALLACALLLFLYAASNTPRDERSSNNLSNINRTPPAEGAGNSQTTPSPAASPPNKPVQKTGAPPSR